MSDLPRFHTGAVGKLDFTALNEMMRRLDAVLPLIESASVDPRLNMKQSSLAFPVFAVPAQTNPGSVQAYEWTELPMNKQDEFIGPSDDDWPDIVETVTLRTGGVTSDEGIMDNRYAVMMDPLTEVPTSGSYCLCVAFRRADSQVRYLLLPAASGGGDDGTVFAVHAAQIFGAGSEVTLPVSGSGGGSVIAFKYPVYRLKLEEDQLVRDGVAQLYDLSYHHINRVTVNATLGYHEMAVGTLLTPKFVSTETAYYGGIPRLTVECL